MRQPLAADLSARHPRLYVPGVRFECHGGWWAILHAVGHVAKHRADETGQPVARVRQIKEKFGTMRFYANADEHVVGAIRFAEEITTRVCEITGRPGRARQLGGWMCTLADGVAPDAVLQSWEGRLSPSRCLCAMSPASLLEAVRVDWPSVWLNVPPGWADLADVLLGVLSKGGERKLSGMLRVSGDGRLAVDLGHGDDHFRGVVACATELAWWVDPTTGEMGPIRDGLPSWRQPGLGLPLDADSLNAIAERHGATALWTMLDDEGCLMAVVSRSMVSEGVEQDTSGWRVIKTVEKYRYPHDTDQRVYVRT